MAKFNIDKVCEELEKASIEELTLAFFRVKEFVSQKLIEEQATVEEKANKLQHLIDNL